MESRMIYLIRHGKIQVGDDQRRYIGQLDLPLSGEGVRQAQNLQRKLDCADIGAIYCSDLLRSRQTAEIIAADKSVPIMPRRDLREISLGEWEGCTFSEVAQRFPAEFRARGSDIGYYRVPGGESFADCSKRVVKAFYEVLGAPTGHILVVGHAGVNRLLLCHLLGMPISNLFRIVQDYGCLNIIQCSNTGFNLKLVNFK